MEGWNTEFCGISMRCPEYFVQIKNDAVLREFLNQEGTGSMELASVMKELYQGVWERELQISETSLAIEIIAHVFADDFLEVVEKLPFAEKEDSRFSKLLDTLKDHMEIIDCGEKEFDHNRFIWDALSPFSKLIFAVVGKRA